MDRQKEKNKNDRNNEIMGERMIENEKARM